VRQKFGGSPNYVYLYRRKEIVTLCLTASHCEAFIKKGGTAMKPVRYNYEAEEYDLDNVYNEDDDRRDNGRGPSQYETYGHWEAAMVDTSIWYD
jgi:hypothetical protein